MPDVRSHNEGTIYLRADTLRWTAQVTMRDGSRPAAGCKHTDHKPGEKRACQEAKAELAKLIALRDRGAPASARNVTLGRFLETWLVDVRGHLAPATWRKHRSVIRVHLIPALGHRRLSDLSVADVRAFLAGRDDLDPQTRRHHRSTLRRALGDGLRDGLITRNVAALAEPPRMNRKQRTYLDADQAKALIDGTRDDRYHALWTLAVTTGMRESEMLALRWSDVDLAGRTVSVSRTLHRTRPGDPDYDRKDPWAFLPPKTDKSRRTIPLATVTVDALRAHERRQLEERMAAGKPGKGLVFTTPAGQPIHGTNLLPLLYAHLERLGLPRVTIHDLRHSAATVLLASGVPLPVIAAILGHSTIRVTADLYAHVVPELSRDAADRMQGAVG